MANYIQWGHKDPAGGRTARTNAYVSFRENIELRKWERKGNKMT